MNKNFNSPGFTLIEMLVSIAIIITSTTVVVAILASSFRGVAKSTLSEDIRQNGNGALTRLSRLIQFSGGLKETSLNGVEFFPVCRRDEEYISIKVKSGVNLLTLSCKNNDISIDDGTGPVSLLDDKRVTVEPGSCIFTCIQDNGLVPPAIGISFELKQNTSGSESNTPELFSTTVKMRNL